jgi:hypothetical protein
MVNPLSPCVPRRSALGSTETPCTHAWPQAALAAMHVAARKRHVFSVHTHSTHTSQRASAHTSSAPHRCDAELRAAVRVNPERGFVAPGAWAARLRRHLKGRAGATQIGPGLAKCLVSAATHACDKAGNTSQIHSTLTTDPQRKRPPAARHAPPLHEHDNAPRLSQTPAPPAGSWPRRRPKTGPSSGCLP